MYNMIQKDTVIEAITWLKQHNPHYADIIPNDDWYSSITNSELTTLVHEHAVHQETSQSTVVNINTQTHDQHLDDTEQIHEQQSADDILNVDGNKAVVIENNTNDDEETDNDLQEEQVALDHKQQLTGDSLPSLVQIENWKIIYRNISYLKKTLKSWHFLISFHMVKEGIIQNEVQNYLYESTSNSIC